MARATTETAQRLEAIRRKVISSPGVHVENKNRKARIDYWEGDGKYIDVAYTQEDGQRVKATFKRIGWRVPPKAVLDQVTESLNHGPIHVTGRRG